jgi:hypothetical protein
MEEVQYSTDGPVPRRDTEDKSGNNCEQQQEREHECGHKFFPDASNQFRPVGRELPTFLIGGGELRLNPRFR